MCHDILMLAVCSIKWGRSPDMTIAVDLDAEPQPEQNISPKINENETH